MGCARACPERSEEEVTSEMKRRVDSSRHGGPAMTILGGGGIEEKKPVSFDYAPFGYAQGRQDKFRPATTGDWPALERKPAAKLCPSSSDGRLWITAPSDGRGGTESRSFPAAPASALPGIS